MQINNNQHVSFGCIRIKNGGLDFLKREGQKSVSMLETAQEACKSYSWHLDINSDGYKLVNPQNKQTYSGPFEAIKHLSKKKLSISMKNINNNTSSYGIDCSSKEEVSSLAREIRKLSGFERMLKILSALENRFIVKH